METIKVFGVSNSDIATYIQRDDVDARFVEGLGRDKHIIVFGASKQGKTALTNKHLQEGDFIRINCSPDTVPLDIYKSILRQLQVEFEEDRTVTSGSELSGQLGAKAKVKIPLIGDIELNASLADKEHSQNQTKFKTIEYNLSLPQDISEVLRSINFKKRIILENFHYLGKVRISGEIILG